MRKLLCILLVFYTPTLSFGQTTYISVTGGGNWNNANTWDVDFDDSGGDGIPGANDIAIVFGDGAGGGTVNITSNVEVGDLYVVNDNANVLSKAGLPFATYTLTIHGQLAGLLSDFSDFGEPTTTVIETDQRLEIVFTNDNAIAPNITSWGLNSPLRNVTVNPTSSSTTLQFEDVAIHTSLDINNGTLSINSGFQVSDATGSSTITVASGSTLNINGGVNGGANTNNFSTVTLSSTGVVNVGINGYLNSSSLNLASSSILNVLNNEANGWFHTNATGPSGGTFDSNSLVSFTRNGDQGIFARTYGNLTLSTAGAGGNKNLSASGTLTVEGDLSIGTSTTFVTTNNGDNIFLEGNLFNNSGALNFTRPVFFQGAVTHIVTGPVTFDNVVIVSPSNSMDIDDNVVFNASIFDNNNNFNFAGDFTFNGTTFNQGSGTLTFDASGAQQIAGSGDINFRNITLSNSTMSINATNASLSGTFSASGGSIDFDGGGSGSFTLISDASGTASVGDLTTTTTTGNINFQRYFDGSGDRWRNFGVGVTGATVSNITGSGFTINGNDLARYNEAETTLGTVDDGWVLQSTFGSSIAQNRGYSMYTRAEEMTRTVTFTGSLNTGNRVLPVSRTSTGSVVDDGWNLVNNPYASTIDWDLLTTLNLDPFAYVWNGSSYNTVGAGGDISTGFISSGQAFWVHSSSGTPSLTVEEADKVSSSTAFLRSAKEEYENRIVVSLTNGLESDKTYIWFRPGSTENFDEAYDALKLNNAIFNLYTKSPNGEKLAINSAGNIGSCAKSVGLSFDNIAPGSYQLNLTGLNTFSNGETFELLDNFSGTTSEIVDGTSYTFEVTSDISSWGDNRFELQIKKNTIITDLILNSNFTCDDEYMVVNIDYTQIGMVYKLLIGDQEVANSSGTGDNLDINIPKSLLVDGENTIDVQVENTSCGQFELVAGALIIDNVLSAEIIEVTNGVGCANSEVVLSASSSTAGVSYRWYESIDADVAITGETNSKLVTSNLGSSKSYYVSAVNSQGCESDRVLVEASIIPIPLVEIEKSGNTLRSTDEFDTYQWFKDNILITDATSNSIEVNESGIYKLQVTSSGCTSDYSNDIIMSLDAVTGLNNDELTFEDVLIYPNPIGDETLKIDFRHISDNIVQVLVSDSNGKLLSQKPVNKGIKELEIDFNGKSKGIYYLHLVSERDRVIYKLIKY